MGKSKEYYREYYRKNPAKKIAINQKYKSSAKGIATTKKYEGSAKRKAANKACAGKYEGSAKGKAARKAYAGSAKGKARHQKYAGSAKGKASIKKTIDKAAVKTAKSKQEALALRVGVAGGRSVQEESVQVTSWLIARIYEVIANAPAKHGVVIQMCAGPTCPHCPALPAFFVAAISNNISPVACSYVASKHTEENRSEYLRLFVQGNPNRSTLVPSKNPEGRFSKQVAPCQPLSSAMPSPHEPLRTRVSLRSSWAMDSSASRSSARAPRSPTAPSTRATSSASPTSPPSPSTGQGEAAHRTRRQPLPRAHACYPRALRTRITCMTPRVSV